MLSKILLILLLFNISIINSKRLQDIDYLSPEGINLIRKINRLLTSPGDEHLIRNLARRFRKYLLNYYKNLTGTNEESLLEEYENITILRNNFSKEENGVYEFFTKEKVVFDKGYQVSFENPNDTYSDEEYIDLCFKMSLISDYNLYLSIYDNISRFSFYFDDYEIANTLGLAFNQSYIYDWSTNTEIGNNYSYIW